MRIQLYEMFCTDTLRHRETARKILTKIPPEIEEVTIDFNRIDFASRSFLHELLFGLGNRKVYFSNANEEVEQMRSIILKNAISVTH